MIDVRIYLNANETDILDIAMSLDNTWLTRGHKSMIGVGCVVHADTGLVIDSVLLSTHCQTCAKDFNMLQVLKGYWNR